MKCPICQEKFEITSKYPLAKAAARIHVEQHSISKIVDHCVKEILEQEASHSALQPGFKIPA